jgi:hypothetical protein
MPQLSVQGNRGAEDFHVKLAETGPADAGELIARIPGIGGGASGIHERREVAVEIIGLSGGAKRGLLIIRIVGGGRECGRQIGARKGPASLDPIARGFS